MKNMMELLFFFIDFNSFRMQINENSKSQKINYDNK